MIAAGATGRSPLRFHLYALTPVSYFTEKSPRLHNFIAH
jgi:hypothetical protein